MEISLINLGGWSLTREKSGDGRDDDHDDDGDASGSFCLLRALFVCSKAKFHF